MPFSIIRIKAAVDGYPLSMTSYRHPRPMEACGFVPFLLEVPNSSRFSLVVGILTPEPSALWKRHLLSLVDMGITPHTPTQNRTCAINAYGFSLYISYFIYKTNLP